jgi:hypothetical protein
MGLTRRIILAAGAAAAATAALPRAFAQQDRRAKGELGSSTKKAPFASGMRRLGPGPL